MPKPHTLHHGPPHGWKGSVCGVSVRSDPQLPEFRLAIDDRNRRRLRAMSSTVLTAMSEAAPAFSTCSPGRGRPSQLHGSREGGDRRRKLHGRGTRSAASARSATACRPSPALHLASTGAASAFPRGDGAAFVRSRHHGVEARGVAQRRSVDWLEAVQTAAAKRGGWHRAGDRRRRGAGGSRSRRRRDRGAIRRGWRGGCYRWS